MTLNKMVVRKIAIVAIVVFLGTSAIVWASGHAFLEIRLSSNDSASNVTYKLTSQHGKTTIISSSKEHVRPLVRSGQYIVFASSGNQSVFSTAKVGGFLSRTTLNQRLVTESSREAVGSNPDGCMYSIESRFYSGACNEWVGDVKEHFSATPDMPTYTDVIPTNTYGTLMGMIPLKQGGAIILLQDTIGEAGYFLQQIDAGFMGSERMPVPVADKELTYAVQPYGQGFIIYGSDGAEGLYYTSPTSQPSVIKFQKPKTPNMGLVKTFIQEGAIINIYSNQVLGEVEKKESKPGEKSMTEFIIQRENGKTDYIQIGGQFSDGALCDNSLLCTLGGDGTSVYDISNTTKPIKKYSLHDKAFSILPTPVGLRYISNTGVYALNASEESGYIEYSFGEYQYCGASSTLNGYVVCVDNEKNGSVALQITPDKKDIYSIDKKVLALSKNAFIESVSLNRGILYMFPLYNEGVFDGPGTDKSQIKTINNTISEAVKKSQIEKTGYKIIVNSYEP